MTCLKGCHKIYVNVQETEKRTRQIWAYSCNTWCSDERGGQNTFNLNIPAWYHTPVAAGCAVDFSSDFGIGVEDCDEYFCWFIPIGMDGYNPPYESVPIEKEEQERIQRLMEDGENRSEG